MYADYLLSTELLKGIWATLLKLNRCKNDKRLRLIDGHFRTATSEKSILSFDIKLENDEKNAQRSMRI